MYYFTKEDFLFLSNRKAYFVGLDLNIYEINYEELKKYYYVNWELADKFYSLNYTNLDDYFKDYKEFIEKFKKKKVVIGFTGGKDSVVLALALEKLEIEYIPVYSHIPYIAELLYFLSKDIYEHFDVRIIEINKKEVEEILKKPLYVKCPLRGLKMRYLRNFLKKLNLSRSNLVTGERVYESPSRYEKLKNKIHNPIQFLTDLDAFAIAIKNNLLSKVYYINARASCIPCPRASTIFWYLGLKNLELFEPKGYELLIEGLEKDYYQKNIKNLTKEQFIYLGFQRIHPKKINEHIKFLEKIQEEAKIVRERKVYEILKKFIEEIKEKVKRN